VVGVEGIAGWVGRDVVDREGEKVGKLADVYYDTADSEAVFVSVKSGAFGRSHAVAPLQGATLARDYVRLDAPKELVKDAPSEDAGGRLTGIDATAVLVHYGRAPEPDLEGEERVCFQTAGAAAETERKRAELAAAEAREVEQAHEAEQGPDAEQERETAASPAGGSVVAEATPEPDRDLAEEDRPAAPAPGDVPLTRLEQLERRVAALEAQLG